MLAIATWVYISEVVLREKDDQQSPLQKIITTYRFTSKEMGIEPIFVGNPPSGYVFLREEVIVQPKQILIVGPRPIVEKAKSVKTNMIDLSEYTRTTTTEVGLSPLSRHIDIGKVTVKVTIPIKKTGQ